MAALTLNASRAPALECQTLRPLVLPTEAAPMGGPAARRAVWPLEGWLSQTLCA